MKHIKFKPTFDEFISFINIMKIDKKEFINLINELYP